MARPHIVPTTLPLPAARRGTRGRTASASARSHTIACTCVSTTKPRSIGRVKTSCDGSFTTPSVSSATKTRAWRRRRATALGTVLRHGVGEGYVRDAANTHAQEFVGRLTQSHTLRFTAVCRRGTYAHCRQRPRDAEPDAGAAIVNNEWEQRCHCRRSAQHSRACGAERLRCGDAANPHQPGAFALTRSRGQPAVPSTARAPRVAAQAALAPPGQGR